MVKKARDNIEYGVKIKLLIFPHEDGYAKRYWTRCSFNNFSFNVQHCTWWRDWKISFQPHWQFSVFSLSLSAFSTLTRARTEFLEPKFLRYKKKCKRTKYMWCWWHDVDDNERISERTNQLDDDNDNDNSIVQFRIIFLFRAFFSVGDKREKLFLWAIFPHRSMRFRSLRIALSSLFFFFY